MSFKLNFLMVEPCDVHIGWVEAQLLCDDKNIDSNILEILLHEVLPQERFDHILLNSRVFNARNDGTILDYQNIAQENYEVLVDEKDIQCANLFMDNYNKK
jgi:hypothetical protein